MHFLQGVQAGSCGQTTPAALIWIRGRNSLQQEVWLGRFFFRLHLTQDPFVRSARCFRCRHSSRDLAFVHFSGSRLSMDSKPIVRSRLCLIQRRLETMHGGRIDGMVSLHSSLHLPDSLPSSTLGRVGHVSLHAPVALAPTCTAWWFTTRFARAAMFSHGRLFRACFRSMRSCLASSKRLVTFDVGWRPRPPTTTQP